MNYREEIKKITRTIPKTVTTGGVMTAVMWKEKVAKALKIASNSRSSEVQLKNVFEELRHF